MGNAHTANRIKVNTMIKVGSRLLVVVLGDPAFLAEEEINILIIVSFSAINRRTTAYSLSANCDGKQ